MIACSPPGCYHKNFSVPFNMFVNSKVSPSCQFLIIRPPKLYSVRPCRFNSYTTSMAVTVMRSTPTLLAKRLMTAWLYPGCCLVGFFCDVLHLLYPNLFLLYWDRTCYSTNPLCLSNKDCARFVYDKGNKEKEHCRQT